VVDLESVVTRKGQVTIPAPIRQALGLKRGDRVAFIVERDHVRLAPRGSVVARTAGVFRRYSREPVPTAEELRDAVEQAIAEEVVERMRQSEDA
jgi:AbrB family looped-hinge helix DNA binding protein